MMTRKEFLTRLPLAAVVPALVPAATLLASCSPGGVVVRATSTEGVVAIPPSALEGLGDPMFSARVFVDDEKSPVYLYRQGSGELTAVLGVCTHKGCTVRKLRNGFECPCHGSEYDSYGNVISGPAPEPLVRLAVIEDDRSLSLVLKDSR